MKKLLPRLLLLLALVAVAVFVVWPMLRSDPIRVSVASIQKGIVESTVANTRAGTVHARRRALLAPSTGGQVAELPVKEGDLVTAGQLLLVLWNQDLKAELQLRTAEAKRASALSEEAKVRWEYAERDAKRLRELRKTDNVSESKLDAAVSEANAAKARWQAAKELVHVRESSIATVQAQIEKTVVRAPFAGQIAEVNAELGEFATPSPTGIPTLPTIDLIDRTSLYVKAPIDEVDAAAVRIGQEVRVTLDAFGDRVFAGKVRRIAPYVLDREKQARTVDVEVDFADKEPLDVLLPGYSANVEVVLQVRKDVLRVPTEAVLQGNRVLVLQADDTLSERKFEGGVSNWKFTEVLSGLQKGDRVVVSLDVEGVEDGASVVVDKGGR